MSATKTLVSILPGVSHVDHGLTPAQTAYVLGALNGEAALTLRVGNPPCAFFICEVELPTELGTVPCALLGPVTGGPAVPESACFRAKRGDRPNVSRLTRQAPTLSRRVTVIGGVSKDRPTAGVIVFTAYGGPLAPQEVGDPFLATGDLPVSERFWSEHALSAEAFGL